MQSDVLILFSTPQSDSDLSKASACLMAVDRSVLVHRKDDSDRLLLVKFSPEAVTPAHLLQAVHNAGFEASMAGG